MKSILRKLAIASTTFACMTSAPVNAADTTLNWALWDWSNVAYYQPLIEAYEAANPGVKVEYTDLGSADYNQMVMTQLTGGGDDLDIISIKDVPGYAQMVSTGRLLNLTEAGAVPEDTSPYGGLVETLELDGAVYGLPMRTDFWILYYNKKLFDDAGVAYPGNDMTWAEFDEKARAVTSGFGADKIYGGHFHTWRSTVQMAAIQDGKQTLIDDDYSFLAPHYERVLGMQEDGIIRSYASLKTSQTHYSAAFYSGNIAMLPMGTWLIGSQIAKVASNESLATEWGVVKFPHPEGVTAGSTAGNVTALGINSSSKNAEASADFITWVSGPEGARIIAETGTIPALRDEAVMSTITSRDGYPSDAESAQALVTSGVYLELPVHPNAADYELVLNRAHDALMTNNTTIEDAVAEMNAGVAEID